MDGVQLPGVRLIVGTHHVDERGTLRKVLAAPWGGAPTPQVVDEVLTTANHSAGTVRGMHYQVAPSGQTKTLWVTQGSLYDVLVDVRPAEPTYGEWMGVVLSADDDLALHVPAGIAHGYQTLVDETTLTYLIRGSYVAEHARTLRWDDARVGISWPLPVSVISERDLEGASWPPG